MHGRPDLELPGLHRFHWYVSPEDIRADAVAGRSVPQLIIFPTYDRLAETQLTELATTEAVRRMAADSFNFHERGRAGLATLAAVARRSRAYRLTVNNLDDACRTVLSLID